MFAAILQFDSRPDCRDDFLRALIDHGRAAVSDESGTLRFDVIEAPGDPNRIYLYEGYVDTDALAAHISSASHQQLVHTLTEHDWLVKPLAGLPRPFAPFFLGSGTALFSAEEARGSSR